MDRRGLAVLLLAGCGRAGFNELPGCGDEPEPDVVALYAFDDELGDDATGAHPAMLRGELGRVPGACGHGLAAQPGYLLVPDAPSFDLETGSVELFVHTTARGQDQTLIARDALGSVESEGHFMLFVNIEGKVVVRMQRGDKDYFRCGPALPPDRWTHVGVSFGGTPAQGLRLWVDGVAGTESESTMGANRIMCVDTPPPGGMSGNNNALLIGASNYTAVDADDEPEAAEPLLGAIDQVRVRSTWRDFSVQ